MDTLKHRSHPKQPLTPSRGVSGDDTKRPVASTAGPTRSTAARKWLFRIAAIAVIPLFLLASAEGVLRLAGYGYSTHFFKEADVQGRKVFVENDKFGLRFFAPELARTPPPVVMPAEKTPGTYRIFLLGESAALGDPRPAYGMGRYLEALLRERFPETEFEVVCVAMTAINSHAILPIARECASHQGDLWVIYMGNNEMVGPFGAATVFGRQVPSLVSIRLSLVLKSMRLGQWLGSWIGKWQGKPAGPWGGMTMFANQQVAPGDPRREVAHRHFARNLEDILSQARKAGCPVLLSTVAVNLRDCAPLGSLHAATADPETKQDFEALRQTGVTHEAAGQWDTALAQYNRAQALDPAFAEIDFRLGQCLLRQTNIVEAGKAFAQARDADALPFRADSTINRLIREAAARHQGRNVWLVPADEILGRQAVDRVPGSEFFFEHVHLNFTGNYLLAKTMAETLEPLLPTPITQRRSPAWASQEICERRLGLTDWNRIGVLEDVLRRLQAPPFTRQINQANQLAFWRTELNNLKARLTPEAAAAARALYRDALWQAPRDHRLHEGCAEFLEAVGSIEEATARWRSVCDLLPHHFAAYVHAGRLLGRQKQWSSAAECLRTALALEPRSGEGHLELARVLADQGNLAQAIDQYQLAIHWQPGNARIYYHLADTLARQDNRSAAMEALQKAIQIQPSFWEARYLLGVELAMSNRIAEARIEFEEVLRARPDHALAHLNLGVALARQGMRAEAQRHFEETLRLDPNNPKARQMLKALSSTSPAE